MAIARIETPREFFDHVVEVDVAECLRGEPDLRKAYHACISLFSLRDWIVETCKGRQWMSSGVAQPAIATKKQFLKSLVGLDGKFAIVTDIANASKHMMLEPGRGETTLYGAANTEIHTTGGMIAGGGIGFGPIAGSSASRIMVKIGNQFHDVKDCIISVGDLWRRLMTENSW